MEFYTIRPTSSQVYIFVEPGVGDAESVEEVNYCSGRVNKNGSLSRACEPWIVEIRCSYSFFWWTSAVCSADSGRSLPWYKSGTSSTLVCCVLFTGSCCRSSFKEEWRALFSSVYLLLLSVLKRTCLFVENLSSIVTYYKTCLICVQLNGSNDVMNH